MQKAQIDNYFNEEKKPERKEKASVHKEGDFMQIPLKINYSKNT